MGALKTQPSEENVIEFIHSFANTEQKIQDSLELLKFMQDVTGYSPKMWGASMIGFGQYHYKSDRSRQEGDWPLVGFSPRKAAISLYVYSGCNGQEDLLSELGQFKMGKSCIYIKKLSDIHLKTLEKMIKSTIKFLESKYG